jgi:N-acetyl-anhydromuramyl-L-alanine amidase AmpD
MSNNPSVQDFFDQLQTFSWRVFDLLEIQERESPWRTEDWPPGKLPKGVVVHFTASPILSALRWFMRRKNAAQASAHLVIAKDWPEGWAELAADLPLVRALSTAVVQCVRYGERAWHATWTNPTHYGIELENYGELRMIDGKWRWWASEKVGAPEWTAKWAGPETPVPLFGRFWAPYSAAQVNTLISAIRRVREVLPSIRFTQVLGHMQVQENKNDPGPCFPLAHVRQHLLETDGYRMLDGVGSLPVNELEADRQRRAVIAWANRSLPLTRGQPYPAVLASVRLAFRHDDAKFWSDSRLLELAFDLLGYYVDPEASITLETVQTFQRMMGLVVDGVVGPDTRRGLLDRMVSMGVFK